MEHILRQKLVEASVELVRLGLNQGTAGNIAVRFKSGLLITPSGVAPAAMRPKGIARLDMLVPASPGGERFDGPDAPSSEWRLHRDILSHRPDIGAIVHTHSLYATVLSTLHRPIPALHYMIAAFGGPEIRCTPYAPFGTQALSDLILAHLGDHHGVLLGNHGMVATGADLDQAMWRAGELETLAKMAFLAGCAGTPVILPDDEIRRVVERFRSYGATAERAP